MNKVYSILFFIILTWTFCITVYSLLDTVKAVLSGGSLVIHIFGGIIFPIAYFICTTMAATNKSMLLTITAPIFPGVGLITAMASGSSAHDTIAAFCFAIGPVSLIICGIMIYAHRRYEWLTQQEGFPHFQTLLDEQLRKSRDMKENDPYAKRLEELKKNAPDHDMDVITAGTDTIESKKTEKNNYMDEL